MTSPLVQSVAKPWTIDQAAMAAVRGSGPICSRPSVWRPTRENGFGALLSGDKVWVVVTVEVGSEHDLEMSAVHDCGSHVGHADLDEVARRVEGSAELVGEEPPALRRQGGEQAALVAEVVGGGGV